MLVGASSCHRLSSSSSSRARSPAGRNCYKNGLLVLSTGSQVSSPRSPFATIGRPKSRNTFATSPQASSPVSTPLRRTRSSTNGLGLAGERMVMQELRELGASWHPLYNCMRSSTAREVLQRTQAAGDLKGVQSALRAARQSLGLDDELVKRVGKQLVEVERCMRACKGRLLEDDLVTLSTAMVEVESMVSRARWCGFGPRLWEDPWLGWAQARVNAWMVHDASLLQLATTFVQSPKSYCVDWASVAFDGDASLRSEFGGAMTKKLIHVPNAGQEIVDALAYVFERSKVSHDELAAKIAGVTALLGLLDNTEIESLILNPVREGLSALRMAANLQTTNVFSCLFQAIIGERLLIDEAGRRRLEREAAGTSSKAPVQQRAAARVAELLQVPLDQLCWQRRADDGLVIRLIGDAQPTVEVALERLALGAGATAERSRRAACYDKELLEWEGVGRARLHAVHVAYVERLEAEGRARAASSAHADAVAALAAAEAELVEPAAVVAAAIAHKADCDAKVAEIWPVYTDMRDKVQEAATEEGDDADEKYEALNAQLDILSAKLQEARDQVSKAQTAITEAKAAQADVLRCRDEAKMRCDAAAATDAECEGKAQEAAARHELLLRTRIAGNPSESA